MTRPVVVGIDLGTTNSLCAVFRDGQAAVDSERAWGRIDAVGGWGAGIGEILVGSPAKELRVTQPDRCASTFKRFMGTDRKVVIAANTFTAPELSSLVLKSLKNDAEAFLKCEVTEAVITVPAYFNDHTSAKRLGCRTTGGTEILRIVNERRPLR